MLALLAFVGALIVAILGGALAAVPVYELASLVVDVPFNKVVSRTTLVSGLLFSLLYCAYYRGFSPRRLGLTRERAMRRLGGGLAAGLLVIAVIEASLLLLGVHRWDGRSDVASLSLLLLAGLATGLLVGGIEELIFRGALYGGLSYRTRPAVALSAVSLVYAATHFLRFHELPANADTDWLTGVRMIPSALSQFADPARYDAMLTLFLLGLLLGLTRIITGSILPCIGLHAGVVAAEKVSRHVTDFTPYSPYAYLVNRYDPYMGDLASVWLLLGCLCCYFYYRLNGDTRRKTRQPGQLTG